MEEKQRKSTRGTGKNISIDGRVLPNNFEAEQVVLGCALIDNEATLLVVSKVEDIDFYNETHRNIFLAIKELFKRSAPVDFISVSDELERQGKLDGVGGINYLSTLSNIVPSSASCGYYIEIVKRCSILRQLIQASGRVIEKAYDKDSDINLIGIAEKAIFDIAEKGQSGSLEKIDKPIQGVIDKFEAIHREGGSVHGLKTGFYQIDKATNGLQKTDLIILAARPGVGKTSLAMNIATNAAINSNAKCAIFSFEMGSEQLATRMLCSVANVSMAKALRGELTSVDWEKIWKAKQKLDSADIYIDVNSGNTPSQILSKCRKLKREKGGLDLVVIDYIGLVESDEKTDNRQNEIAKISKSLKALAKDVDVPVITLCQLNRDIEKQETGKDGKPRKPVLSDLRESGQIEQDADMVWFIHRDMSRNEIDSENKNYTAELIIAKFRNGQPGSVFIGWDGSRTSFYNLERDSNEQSLVNAYEKHSETRKKPNESIEDIKSKLNGIINEMNTDVENNASLMKNIEEKDFNDFDDGVSGLTPPPEQNEEMDFNSSIKFKDFSNVNIDDDDDELF